MLIVHMNDIILIGDNLLKIERLKKVLAFEFEIKDLGSLRHFLGMEVACSKKGIVVHNESTFFLIRHNESTFLIS